MQPGELFISLLGGPVVTFYHPSLFNSTALSENNVLPRVLCVHV